LAQVGASGRGSGWWHESCWAGLRTPVHSARKQSGAGNMKKKKLRYTELRSLDSAIEQLQALVDGLRAGVLSLERGEQQLQLKPGAVLDFALSAEREGVQERFELTLEWRRQDLTIGSGPARSDAASRPRSMPVPAGRGLALQAEAERLFEEDDAEAPLSSDDDYTLAPDEVDAPPLQGPLLSASEAPSSVAALLEREDGDDEAVTVRHSSPPAGQPVARRAAPTDPEWIAAAARRAAIRSVVGGGRAGSTAATGARQVGTRRRPAGARTAVRGAPHLRSDCQHVERGSVGAARDGGAVLPRPTQPLRRRCSSRRYSAGDMPVQARKAREKEASS
jgi:amphi-Trp domain-containing protein